MIPDSRRSIRFVRPVALGHSELSYVHAYEGAAAPDRRSAWEISLIDHSDKTVVYRGNKQRIVSGLVGVRTPFEAGKLVRHHTPETRARMLAIASEEIRSCLSALKLRSRDLPDLLAYVDDSRLRATANAVFRAVEQPSSKLEQQERLSRCAMQVVRIVTRRSSDEQAIITRPVNLRRVRELLHDRLSEDVGLDELAREINLSKHYLVRAFERQFGAPPHQYLMQIRVERARALLAQGSQPTRVALDCGFYDQSHLNRWFRKVVGMTPVDYAGGS